MPVSSYHVNKNFTLPPVPASTHWSKRQRCYVSAQGSRATIFFRDTNCRPHEFRTHRAARSGQWGLGFPPLVYNKPKSSAYYFLFDFPFLFIGGGGGGCCYPIARNRCNAHCAKAVQNNPRLGISTTESEVEELLPVGADKTG